MPQQKVVFDPSIHRIERARTHFLKDAGSFHLLICVSNIFFKKIYFLYIKILYDNYKKKNHNKMAKKTLGL